MKTKRVGFRYSMTFEEFREVTWGTADNRWIKVRDLEDTHLANIIRHVEERPLVYGFVTERMVNFFKQEAELRKLKQAFLERAPIPWRDTDGRWKRFSDKLNGYEVIGR